LLSKNEIGLILDNDSTALNSSAEQKKTIGLFFENDPSSLGSGAEQKRNRLIFKTSTKVR